MTARCLHNCTWLKCKIAIRESLMFDPWNCMWEVKCYINTHLCDLNMWQSHQEHRHNTLEIFTFRNMYLLRYGFLHMIFGPQCIYGMSPNNFMFNLINLSWWNQYIDVLSVEVLKATPSEKATVAFHLWTSEFSTLFIGIW